MSRTTHPAGALLLAMVLLVLTGCSAGPSSRPPVAVQEPEQQVSPPPAPPKPAPVPPLGGPAKQLEHWGDCTDRIAAKLAPVTVPAEMNFTCSKLLTTLDSPEDPGTGTSRLSVLAAGEGTIPLVVVNDIGGEPGTTFAARLALQLPPELLDTFRIIGMDRRGSGESDPADCVPPQRRQDIVGFNPRATERAQLDQLLDAVRNSSQECLLDLDDRLLAFDSWRTAGDLEELRLEMGVPKLHAIGRGEGSRVVTTYTERFPESVGRMVLDGGPDPGRDALGRHEQEARSAEATFDAFAEDCLNGGCPLGPDPRAMVNALLEKVQQTPLAAGNGRLEGGHVVRAMLAGLSEPQRWPELANALKEAERGNGTELMRFVSPMVNRGVHGAPQLDAELITGCNDTTLRVPPERTAQTAADWVNRFPLFGGVFAQRLTWCGQWPVPQQPLPTPKNPRLPAIPVISTAQDPLTPKLGTQHLADQLSRGVIVNWQGAGHGALGRSDCATGAATQYLVEGILPENELACPA